METKGETKMTELESKILTALTEKTEKMNKFDALCKAEYDEKMRKAEAQTVEYWKNDLKRQAEWSLGFQHHGYDFLEAWKNEISKAMYGRTYHEWHSAQAGRYKGTGHGAYITTELDEHEREIINKVFKNLIDKGYFKVSKTGKQAKFIGGR